jgi:hypothetical protein
VFLKLPNIWNKISYGFWSLIFIGIVLVLYIVFAIGQVEKEYFESDLV